MATKTLASQTGKPVVLGPVHPNHGLSAAYRKKLDRLIDEMQASLQRWIIATYRRNPPKMAADDVNPTASLVAEMGRLGDRWESRFAEAAPDIAAWFAKAATDRTDFALASALRRAGMSVKFQTTPQVRDVFAATLRQQVSLIKSIAAEHMAGVEGAVLRSVQTGRDIGTLARELEERFGVTKRRAALIATHQNNIATATIHRARQDELGITQAIWLHSGGGRHPRPTHVAQSGKPYTVAKGWYDPAAREWVWPGTLINCGCVSKSIVPGLE